MITARVRRAEMEFSGAVVTELEQAAQRYHEFSGLERYRTRVMFSEDEEITIVATYINPDVEDDALRWDVAK